MFVFQQPDTATIVDAGFGFQGAPKKFSALFDRSTLSTRHAKERPALSRPLRFAV
jgi:hypothetical protein